MQTSRARVDGASTMDGGLDARQERGGFWTSGEARDVVRGSSERLLAGAPRAQVSHCRGTDRIGDARRGSGGGRRQSAVSGENGLVGRSPLTDRAADVPIMPRTRHPRHERRRLRRALGDPHNPWLGQGLPGPIQDWSGQLDVPLANRTPGQLAGGQLLAAVSTRIVAILHEHYGRGPMKAKTYAIDDIIVVVMRGSGFTSLEQTIMDSGEPDRVVAMRHDFQRMMSKRFTETIEELTGRDVVAFLSQAHVEPDITIEIFFVDGPLEGFGAVEILEAE
jgi:uncharacterized protein YbcI